MLWGDLTSLRVDALSVELIGHISVIRERSTDSFVLPGLAFSPTGRSAKGYDEPASLHNKKLLKYHIEYDNMKTVAWHSFSERA